MRKTANVFGLASCTISRIVSCVTAAISTELADVYMSLPQTEEHVRESPAVDGTHIPMRNQEENATDYIT